MTANGARIVLYTWPSWLYAMNAGGRVGATVGGMRHVTVVVFTYSLAPSSVGC